MKKILFTFLLLITSCNYKTPNIVDTYPQDNTLVRKEFAGNMFGNENGIVIFKDDGENSNKKPINKSVIWKNSVVIISEILPIAIVDDKSGLIVTDWGNINNISGNNNLYKLNVAITGEKLSKDNLRISAFRKDTAITTLEAQKIKDKIANKILSYTK